MCALVLFLCVPSWARADTNLIRLKALLNICEIAQKSSDTGTINNIANQIKDIERPDDIILSQKIGDCLDAAFGEMEQNIDIDELLRQISKRALQMKIDCRELLNAAPEVAINHQICKSILLD